MLCARKGTVGSNPTPSEIVVYYIHALLVSPRTFLEMVRRVLPGVVAGVVRDGSLARIRGGDFPDH